MNWQHFMRFLVSIRGRWDLAILANLAEGGARPTDLLDAINEQACDGHQLTWKVMRDRLRHLEDAGYVSRREVRRFPRETHYRATEFAHRLIAGAELAGRLVHGERAPPGYPRLSPWAVAAVTAGPPDGHSGTKMRIRTSR